jgi:hypothetical protein
MGARIKKHELVAYLEVHLHFEFSNKNTLKIFQEDKYFYKLKKKKKKHSCGWVTIFFYFFFLIFYNNTFVILCTIGVGYIVIFLIIWRDIALVKIFRKTLKIT